MRERLIGAAVLIIAAVILIPWLVSRSHHPREQVQSLALPPLASANGPAVLALPPLAVNSNTDSSAPEIASAQRGSAIESGAEHASVAAAPKPAHAAESSSQAQPVEAKSTPPEARIKPPVATATTAIRKGEWYVQVASFPERDGAEEMVGKLSRAGFQVGVSAHEVRGNTWYRVRTGSYPAKATAATLAKRIAKASGTQPLLRQAKGSDG